MSPRLRRGKEKENARLMDAAPLETHIAATASRQGKREKKKRRFCVVQNDLQGI